ncbi:putative 2-C-methyl-D-erythritol 4-phosphate cytidylyltransferase [Slackia sp. CM382]|uniref:IspD/TarI family cytidylyltransferase n=1 Tax=Slackia sp. CM382 TaxID=1111137 RepID=UPI00027C611A|nr:2-C-methyl-D-erythritol 4-phosphate cytidylyltransferase [Slackia sp. CM382]EJU35257.1 putative 2-C-methyl-D-erythritol 4-phosphate cytidylyltransferase [Slackia sp. CM382]
MNFAAILAGGRGTRMGNQDKPKQYLLLDKKPIIAHTVEKFLVMPEFEKVIVLCPDAWVEPTKDILRTYVGESDRLVVIAGGERRNDTIMNAIAYIEDAFGIDDDAVLVTHDSVRPFVTYRIIKDNLDAMASHDACDTVIPATDTIVESVDGTVIDAVPERSRMFQGQTPQTFKIGTLKSLYASLSNEERAILTDACKIFVLRDRKVALVPGTASNIKITYPTDLKIAQALLGIED